MMSEALTWWRNKFGILPPIGYELRDHWEARWSRFHSLPNSKRYPNSPPEYIEIMRRGRALGNALFTPGETIYAFHSVYQFEDTPPVAVPPALESLLSASRARFQVENGEAQCYTRACIFTWPPERFATLLTQVADENLKMFTLVSPATRNVMCPYDGGFDVFSETPEPESLKKEFSEWYSAPEDDL